MHLRNHADTTTSEEFQALKGLCETYIQYKIWIVGSARERDFTAHIVWWHCAVTRLRTLGGTLPTTVLGQTPPQALSHKCLIGLQTVAKKTQVALLPNDKNILSSNVANQRIQASATKNPFEYLKAYIKTLQFRHWCP